MLAIKNRTLKKVLLFYLVTLCLHGLHHGSGRTGYCPPMWTSPTVSSWMFKQMLCKIQQAERALNSSKRGRKNTESTKMHIVYDTSIGENARVPRLNKCLEISPLLQNQLWNVVLSPSKNQRFEASIFANLHVKRRPRCLILLLVKRSDKQASRNLAILSSTLCLALSPFPLTAVIKKHL